MTPADSNAAGPASKRRISTQAAIGIAAVWMRACAVGASRPSSPARRRIVQAALDVVGPLLITALGAALLLSTAA